jgi:hypothetical protein
MKLNHLPNIYKDKHDFCMMLYSQITSMFLGIEQSGSLITRIPDDKVSTIPDIAKIKDLKGYELYNWLKEKGFDAVIFENDYKNCFAALLSDLLQFIKTALDCSVKGQLHVTFALLRTPLKDNLFYLEYLLSDPNAFLDEFYNVGKERKFDISKKNKEEKIKIIKNAIDKSRYHIYDADLMYLIRYDKQCPGGFEQGFELANHLITGHEYYKTNDGNFNFIFSNEDDKLKQWEVLYMHLPALMMHVFQIVTRLEENFVKFDEAWSLLETRFSLGLLHISDRLDKKCICAFKESFRGLLTSCDHCGVPIKYNRRQFFNFYKKFVIKCSNCNKVYNLSDKKYYSDENEVAT